MTDNYTKYLRNPLCSRCEALGLYITETGDTVRGAAKIFGISKSTVHKDITKILKQKNYSLYLQVARVLQLNKQERHIRGGLATRDKYKTLRSLNETGSQKNSP